MSIEAFSERTAVEQPTALRPEEIPTVEMPIVEILPDLHNDYDFNRELSQPPRTSGSSVFKVWWQKVSTFLLGHLM
jgi:hypothetical protein